MKIAVFIYSLEGGGAERVVSQLIPYLEQKAFEVHLIVMNPKSDFSFPNKKDIFLLEKNDGTENGISKLLKIPLLAYKYHRYLKINKIEKSISFLTRPNFISVLTKIFSRKTIIIISERSNPSGQYSYRNIQSRINKFLISKLYPLANLIIANSKGNAEDLIRNFDISKSHIHVIQNPIDLIKIKTIKPIPDFFDQNYFNLITVGRLDKGKNHELLIRSIKKINNPKIRLYILGKGKNFTFLTKLIKELNLENQVFLMGFDPNPYKYMKAADLFIFGSNHEGFPNVLLEAMACDLPIVSTNCPSGPNEIMKANIEFGYKKNFISDFGVLVPVNDSSEMYKGISYMLDNKKYFLQCKRNVKKRVEDFKAEIILEEFYKILK